MVRALAILILSPAATCMHLNWPALHTAVGSCDAPPEALPVVFPPPPLLEHAASASSIAARIALNRKSLCIRFSPQVTGKAQTHAAPERCRASYRRRKQARKAC